MDKQVILEAITNIKALEDLSSWDLQTILADFPFFQTAHLLWAKKAMDTDNYEQSDILHRTAVYAGNRTVLYKLLHQKEIPQHPTPSLLEEQDTIQIDKEELPILITEAEDLDGQETEVVSIDYSDVTDVDLDNQETEVVSVGGLNLPETEADEDDTEAVSLEHLDLPVDGDEESTTDIEAALGETPIDSDTFNEEMADIDEESFEDIAEEKEEEGSDELEAAARSITSALDKSLLKIAQEEEVEVDNSEVVIIPATMEVLQEEIESDEEDKFALKHIFEKETAIEEAYLNTEQISEAARKEVEEALSAKLSELEGDVDIKTPIVEGSSTADMSDLIQQEVQEIIQKDMKQLEEEAEDDFLDSDDMRVNSAVIKASIEEDKINLQESLLEASSDDGDEEEKVHPENEIESDLIMNLKAKVESYKQKKKSFESWLTGDLEKEKRPKVKLSEEDESEIKKFVDFQSEINNGEKQNIPTNLEDIPLEGTESMAEVYAQQGHYKRAVKIYEQLSLKYPEKSSYFAVKIVELQKKL